MALLLDLPLAVAPSITRESSRAKARNCGTYEHNTLTRFYGQGFLKHLYGRVWQTYI